LATISNPTDPNKVVATTSNVTPQVAQPQAASNTTGQYSTLQKYLGANQNSGQRLAGAINNNLTAESKSLTDTTNRELNESDVSNKKIGDLTGQTNVFTGKLNSANDSAETWDKGLASFSKGRVHNTLAYKDPIERDKAFSASDKSAYEKEYGVRPGTTNGGYDAAKYSSNLSGTQAAADIAANRNDLNSFRNIATGNTSDKLRTDSEAEAKQALSASQRAYDTNKNRQSQLSNFNDRSSLLQNAINSKNQRAGLQNLDNALLSQDKSGELNRVNAGLQTNTKNLQEYKNLADARSRDVISLASTQNAAESGLNNRLTDMNKEQQADLEARKMSINEAKATQVASLNDKFSKFKSSGDVDDELYNALELANVRDVDAIAKKSLGINDPSKMTNPDLQPIRMFNAMDGYDKLSNVANMDLLQRNALTGSEVANQQDIDRLGILNTLSGGNIKNDLKLSDFTGTQLGPSSLDDTINQQGQNFLDTMNNQKFIRGQSDSKHNGTWYGGDVYASASNADKLYNNTIKKGLEYRPTARSGNGYHNQAFESNEFAPNTGNPLDNFQQGYSEGDVTRGQFDIGKGEAQQIYRTLVNQGFDQRANRQAAPDADFSTGGAGEALARAEDNAVENISSRIDQDLKNQGYQRLIKRMKQGT
jgi:hypothetical protein